MKIFWSTLAAILVAAAGLEAGSDKVAYTLGKADGIMWAISMRHGEFAQAAIQLQQKQIEMQDPRRSASERKAYLAGFDAGSAQLPHP